MLQLTGTGWKGFFYAEVSKESAVKCVILLNPSSGRKGVGGSSRSPNLKIRLLGKRQSQFASCCDEREWAGQVFFYTEVSKPQKLHFFSLN